ncbi:MAG: peptidoglycan editing factor PgeF [Planctomycetes bacterium]|nr:peptidoglycan editing factor PgeF [Planctomycetota bacterium]
MILSPERESFRRCPSSSVRRWGVSPLGLMGVGESGSLVFGMTVTLHHFGTLSDIEGIVHGVSTRHGGVSRGAFESLNVGLHVGDEAEAVLENRRRLCEAAGVPLDSLVAGAQVLGNAVGWVTAAHRGRGARDVATALPDIDALITDTPGLVLAAFSADCPLLALVDPRRRAVGLVHASRRGTLGRIAARAVRAMERLLGCRPADLRAAIAPSIGPCCYEVGDEALAEARQALLDADRFFARRDGRLHLDLWAANTAQLVEAGLPPQHIEAPTICTCCRSDKFFSHRASGGRTGRFALLLGLR